MQSKAAKAAMAAKGSIIAKARRYLVGAGAGLLLCGLLSAGCSKKEEAPAPQGVYMQVKGKQVNIVGTGCLLWLNKKWSVQLFDKIDSCEKTANSTGKENALSFYLDKTAFPPNEKGEPPALPKNGAEYGTEEWTFSSSSLEDDAVGATVKLRVAKLEKPIVEFEVINYSPDEKDKGRGVEKVGGRVRVMIDDASYWEKLPH